MTPSTTVPAVPRPAPPTSLLTGNAADALREKFPPRPVPDLWPATSAGPQEVLDRLARPPLRPASQSALAARLRGARRLLEWLQGFPGNSWQSRWRASPGPADPQTWCDEVIRWTDARGLRPVREPELKAGMLALICADVIRMHPAWLTVRRSRHFMLSMSAGRDPDGFARLEAAVPPDQWTSRSGGTARVVICAVLATKGGTIQDCTVGDLMEIRSAASKHWNHATMLAYAWLRAAGQFPPDAPASLSRLETFTGQVSIGDLVDRYQLRCRPIRDVIVDYLTERQPSMDYNSLQGLSRVLASNFWADLERHHPGINSLALAPEVADAWKTRLATRTVRRRQPNGTATEASVPRKDAPTLMMSVRAFYLDLAQWALEEPARWGQHAVRCPFPPVSSKKRQKRQKSWSHQRTRERLPHLPALVRAADQHLKDARARLGAVEAAPAGAEFIVLDETYRKARTSNWAADPHRTTTAYLQPDGRRIDLKAAENRAFWAWATIEVLRHTGIRIEEMLELSHHSILQYRLPTTGEVVPLLQIAPSKTDKERVLLVTPELADVLSAIVCRIRGAGGVVPLVVSHDAAERVWNPPMPLLFQWQVNGEDHVLSVNTIRKALNEVIEAAQLTDAAGELLDYQPHDFRRMFITDAIMNGLPPHIAQVIAGHDDINTTMHYNAVYPSAAIAAHQAFIARRRSLRPGEEYRVPTSEEWEAFLSHFERRKLSLGTCGRSFGSECVHEHACVRCAMLRVDPHERPRLDEIRANLIARIAEAEREGWLGEVDGLSVSLAAAEDKLAQLDAEVARRSTVVHLGLPTFSQIATRSTAPS
ncbi:tyrosine-type recombinase/integrase [Streptomyces sp. NPDC004244]